MFKMCKAVAILGISLLSALLSCSNSSGHDSDSEDVDSIVEVEVVDDFDESPVAEEELTPSVVKSLFYGIPDHGYDEKTKESVTDDFYSLIRLAFDRPNDNPGGIGSDEWLYYWLSGQEGGTILLTNSIKISKSTPDKAKVTFISAISFEEMGCEEIYGHSSHEMVLVSVLINDANGKSHKEWRVSDFDGHKSRLIKYLNEQYKLFNKDKGRDVWDSAYSSDDSQEESYKYQYPQGKLGYLKEVDNWLKMFRKEFPDGVAK